MLNDFTKNDFDFTEIKAKDVSEVDTFTTEFTFYNYPKHKPKESGEYIVINGWSDVCTVLYSAKYDLWNATDDVTQHAFNQNGNIGTQRVLFWTYKKVAKKALLRAMENAKEINKND